MILPSEVDQPGEVRQRAVFLKKPRWVLGLGIGACALLGTGVLHLARSQATPSILPVLPSTVAVNPAGINALGRLEPEDEVIQLSAPTQLGAGSRVAQLLVDEGDRVQVGQLVAILDSRDRLHASLVEAEKQVQVAQARLAQVRAGADPGAISARQAAVARLKAELMGEIATQQATIQRLQAEAQTVQRKLERNQQLFNEGAVSAAVFDDQQLAAVSAREQLQSAQANLDRSQRSLQAQIQEAQATLKETAAVRPTDVMVAQAEVDRAIAAVERLQAELETAYIRAPKAGQILRVQTRAGELVSPQGIVELGQTDQMVAIAEIYESDIGKIQAGQTAIVTSLSNTFPEQLLGKVDRIGLQIAKRDVLDTDPTAATDARVVEVRVRLDSAASQQVRALTNLQVKVEIIP